MYKIKYTPTDPTNGEARGERASVGQGKDQQQRDDTTPPSVAENPMARADWLQIAGAVERLQPTQCCLCDDEAIGNVTLYYPEDWDYAQCMQTTGKAALCDKHMSMPDSVSRARERWLTFLQSVESRYPLVVVHRYDQVLDGLAAIGVKP